MKWFNVIVKFLSCIDFKKRLTCIAVFIFVTVFVISFIALVVSLLQWGDENGQYAILNLAGHLFLDDFNVSTTFFALAVFQISAFLLVLSPLWKLNRFRIMFAIAMISYPTVFWIILKMYERMRP